MKLHIVNLFAVTDASWLLESRWRSTTGDVVTPGVRVLTLEAEVSLAALTIGTGVEGTIHFIILTCFVPGIS